jgi:DNA-binding transcriptional regulator GbsR (MarR family)
MELSPVMQKFVLHWGEMGTRWGVNRTVAQIHALLYISPRPLTAEEIALTLSCARSNVSTSLKELQGWGIVRPVHVLGDRRDHFESMADVWKMFEIVLTERKRREIDPAVAMLRECVAEADRQKPADRHTSERLAELLEFFQTMSDWYEQVRGLPTRALMKFVRMGSKVRQLVGAGS